MKCQIRGIELGEWINPLCRQVHDGTAMLYRVFRATRRV